MNRLMLTLVISFFILQTVKSQDSSIAVTSKDTVVNPREYNVVIKQVHAGDLKGYFASIQDSSIKITVVPGRKRFSFADPEAPYFQKIDYKSIITVKLYQKKKKNTIVLLSMLIGATAGAIIGYAQGDDSGWFALTAGGKAFVGGLLGVGVGAAVGGLIAAGTEKEYLINGEWKNLQEMKESLQNH